MMGFVDPYTFIYLFYYYLLFLKFVELYLMHCAHDLKG
jgi:hypothetical protein